MKGKVACLIAGAILGGAGSALAVRASQSASVPRGQAATFAGLPDLICSNVRPNMGIPPVAPVGSVAVGCSGVVHSTKPWNMVVFTPDNRVTVLRSFKVVFRGNIR